MLRIRLVAKADVPDEVTFRSKPEIALDRIRVAFGAGIPRGTVLMNAGYGTGTALRTALPELGLAYAVGASLLSEDKCVVGDRKGFNSGIICIPNVDDFGNVMLAISECIDRYARARGRQSLGWFDQAIANYVTFKLCEVDVDILDLHTRWGGRDALHGGVYPRGFVHLWGGKDKVSQMEELTDSLKGASRQGVPGWTFF